MKSFCRGDRGSIPLALLGIIIASGIVVALGSVMVTQTRATAVDRATTQAVQVADAGVQQAVFLANNLGDPATKCKPATPCTGTVQNGTFTWHATPTASGTGYVVTSKGVQQGRTRTLQVELKKMSRFPAAAFGDKGVELKGSNGADSYNSSNPAAGANTGNGVVASNSNVNFNGASTTVDKVVLYNYDAAGNQCNANGNSGACSNVTTLGPKLDLASAASMAFIDDQIAACELLAVGGVLPDWVASKNVNQMNGFNGTPQCFNSLNFDVNTSVVNPPAVLFVKRGVNFEKQKYINCGACPGTRPTAANLQIFSAGTQNLNDSSQDVENVGIGNQSWIGAAIYAPRAACLGNPSAAQADVYGALICGSIGRITSGNQGGWAFHYDDALMQLGTGGFNVTRLDEIK